MLPGIIGLHPIIGVGAPAPGSGAAPTYINNGGLVDNGTAPVNILVPYPSGIQQYDIAFIHAIAINAVNGAARPINTPAGWNLVSLDNINAAAYWHAVFWKRLSGGESGTVTLSQTIGTDNNDCFAGVMSAWRGCVTSGTPYEALANNTGTSASPTGSSVTTTAANETILNFVASDDANLSTPAASWTEQYDLTSPSGADGAMKLCSIEKAAAGTLAGVIHPMAASDRWQVKSLALIPA